MRNDFFSDGCLVIPAIKFKASSGYSLNFSSNFCLWFLNHLLQSITLQIKLFQNTNIITVKHSKIFNVTLSSTLGGISNFSDYVVDFKMAAFSGIPMLRVFYNASTF